MGFGLLSEHGVACIMLCIGYVVGAAVSTQKNLGMFTHLGGTVLRGDSRTDTWLSQQDHCYHFVALISQKGTWYVMESKFRAEPRQRPREAHSALVDTSFSSQGRNVQKILYILEIILFSCGTLSKVLDLFSFLTCTRDLIIVSTYRVTRGMKWVQTCKGQSGV